MLKKYLLLALATVLFTFQILVNSAFAVDLDAETRTVQENAAGDTIVLSLEQVDQGKRLFQSVCAQCHVGGVTKTDPNVGLDPKSLAFATPARDNIEALVDYMKSPTTYDGAIGIAELHPSKKSAGIFPEMRNLTDEDLEAIAGHILLQPKVIGSRWGGGKIYY